MKNNFTIIKKYLFKIIIFALLSAVALTMYVILGGDFSRGIINGLLTCLTIVVYGVSGLCSTTIYNKLKTLSLVGLWTSALSLLIVLIAIWEIIDFDYIWKPMVVLIIISITITQISLLLPIKPKEIVLKYLLISTKFFLILTAIMLIKTTITEYNESQLYFRVLALFLICYLFGVIVMPILNNTTKDNTL